MRYQVIPPSPQLKPYVRFFWVLEHDMAPGEPSYIYRSLADGCAEMVFHYKGEFDDLIGDNRVKGWQCGFHFQTAKYNRFITDTSFGLFGAYIYPFAIPLLLNMPSSEGTDQMLPLHEALGADGRVLEEQMLTCPDNGCRVNMLSAFLEKRLLRNELKYPAITVAIKQIIHTNSYNNVKQLAGDFSLSTRQFDRRFKEYAGFSPKLYLRLMRFHSALKQYGSDKSLTEIAYNCGYYDQSHFIHDVKAFSGYHPGYYFSGKAEGLEYRNS